MLGLDNQCLSGAFCRSIFTSWRNYHGCRDFWGLDWLNCFSSPWSQLLHSHTVESCFFFSSCILVSEFSNYSIPKYRNSRHSRWICDDMWHFFELSSRVVDFSKVFLPGNPCLWSRRLEASKEMSCPLQPQLAAHISYEDWRKKSIKSDVLWVLYLMKSCNTFLTSEKEFLLFEAS